MNTKQKIGRACMIVGILLILGALALLGYNQWDANRADKASQDALGKLEETLTETIEDKTKDEEPVVQPELDPEQEMTVTDIDGWGYIGYLSVPSIGLELPVMSEWSYAGLKVALQRLPLRRQHGGLRPQLRQAFQPHQVAGPGQRGVLYRHGRPALEL